MARVQKGRNHIAELKDKAGHLHAVTDAFVPPVIDNLAHTFLPCLNILQPDYCDPAQNRHTGNCRCSTESQPQPYPGNPQYQPQQYPSNPQYHRTLAILNIRTLAILNIRTLAILNITHSRIL
jgi:hypothetical protein